MANAVGMNTNPAVRTGTALIGVAGALLLAGCSGMAEAEQADDDTSSSRTTGPYEDGTYTAEGSYQTPETVETVTVTLTLEDDVVTDVEVVGDPIATESKQYQGQFISGIADEVVGKSLDELDVDRVSGSSLTSGGFDEAVGLIKEQAAA